MADIVATRVFTDSKIKPLLNRCPGGEDIRTRDSASLQNTVRPNRDDSAACHPRPNSIPSQTAIYEDDNLQTALDERELIDSFRALPPKEQSVMMQRFDTLKTQLFVRYITRRPGSAILTEPSSIFINQHTYGRDSDFLLDSNPSLTHSSMPELESSPVSSRYRSSPQVMPLRESSAISTSVMPPQLPPSKETANVTPRDPPSEMIEDPMGRINKIIRMSDDKSARGFTPTDSISPYLGISLPSGTKNFEMKRLPVQRPTFSGSSTVCQQSNQIVKNFNLQGASQLPSSQSGLISDLHYRWDSLEDHLLACYVKYPNIPSIMGGDFNARTAANWNGIIKAKWWVSPPYPKSDLISFTSRRSKDNRVNEAGVLLYQLAIRMNLNILNGNCPPDVPGEFTHLGTTSNSVLDYLLVSEDLFSNFFYFKVDNVQSSDHLPLAAKLTLDWHPVSGTHPIHVGLNATAQVRGIKWSMKQAQKYAEFFQRNSSESLIVSLAELSEPNRILEWFFHFSADLTSFFTMPAHLANRDQPRFGAPWFDAKCKQARLSLCCIYNRYKASGAETLPPEYLQAKIAYKQAQKSAKHEWQLRRWQALIAASKLRSSRGFGI
ncbi:Hypothetical predicted protein [Podarcis lilfordi]|uniref:Endonuclease/exonuclease/phosphatase domain-containing protein n=1 Tax=Podarcis lilfordi TaxID=74358 RepID=A0AA35L0Q5_9SAUR|nr:Hypothetical predicted protein [Podarcis lilfordi]